MNEKQTILEINKNEEGISVLIDACGVDLIIGIAETIQLIMQETSVNKETILSDIDEALKIILKEEEEK